MTGKLEVEKGNTLERFRARNFTARITCVEKWREPSRKVDPETTCVGLPTRTRSVQGSRVVTYGLTGVSRVECSLNLAGFLRSNLELDLFLLIFLSDHMAQFSSASCSSSAASKADVVVVSPPSTPKIPPLKHRRFSLDDDLQILRELASHPQPFEYGSKAWEEMSKRLGTSNGRLEDLSSIVAIVKVIGHVNRVGRESGTQGYV